MIDRIGLGFKSGSVWIYLSCIVLLSFIIPYCQVVCVFVVAVIVVMLICVVYAFRLNCFSTFFVRRVTTNGVRRRSFGQSDLIESHFAKIRKNLNGRPLLG